VAIESFKDDIGLKISLPQKNVNTAADQELIFSSSWPNVSVYKAIHVQVNAPPDVGTLVYEHNLGFVPAVFNYQLATDIYTNGSNGLVNTRSSIFVDRKGIYVYPAAFGATTMLSYNLYLVITTINIEENVQYPTFKTATTRDLLSNTDYGFKVAKVGKSITSTSPRDYVIHSGARSPMVHSVSVGTPSGGYFSASHDLPYTPMFSAFVSTADYAMPGVTLDGDVWQSVTGFAGTDANGQDIRIRDGFFYNKYSIVIFKDPFTQTDIQEISL